MSDLIRFSDTLELLFQETQRDTFLHSLLVRAIDFEGTLPNGMMNALWFLNDAMEARLQRFDSVVADLSVLNGERRSGKVSDDCMRD